MAKPKIDNLLSAIKLEIDSLKAMSNNHYEIVKYKNITVSSSYQHILKN